MNKVHHIRGTERRRITRRESEGLSYSLITERPLPGPVPMECRKKQDYQMVVIP